ncbi:unnamed protein product [Pedinophyceae sp. YPF-701]|nr:unnamed protein product [Pedinophyceae sp. YPF-701]
MPQVVPYGDKGYGDGLPLSNIPERDFNALSQGEGPLSPRKQADSTVANNNGKAMKRRRRKTTKRKGGKRLGSTAGTADDGGICEFPWITLLFWRWKDALFSLIPLAVVGGIFALAYIGFSADRPPDFVCTRDPCEGGFVNNQLASWYTIDIAKNDASGFPRECYATAVTAGNTTTFVNNDQLSGGPGVMWQPLGVNATESCAVRETLHAALFGRAGDAGDSRLPYIAIITAAPLALNVLFMVLCTTKATRKIVDVVLVSAGVMLAAVTAVTAYPVGSLMAILFGFLALFCFVFYALVRTRVRDYGEMVLDTMGMMMQQYWGQFVPMTLASAMLPVALLYGWLALYARLNNRYGDAVDFALFVLLLYSIAFVRNAYSVATAQMAGLWYFKRLKPVDAGRAPLLYSFGLSLTNRSGSVGLGSVFVSFTKVLRIAAGFLRTQVSARLQLLAAAALILEAVMRPFNTFAFSYIPFHNQAFMPAAVQALSVVQETSLSLIMIDDILGATAWVAGLMVGSATLVVAYVIGEVFLEGQEDLAVALYLPAFLAGFAASLAVMDALEAMCNTIYIAFAEDPLQLEETDNTLYLDLFESWQVAIEDQQLLMEEGAGGYMVEGPRDDETLSRSSFGSQTSEVAKEVLDALPNVRMKKDRAALSHPKDVERRRGEQSLFRRQADGSRQVETKTVLPHERGNFGGGGDA